MGGRPSIRGRQRGPHVRHSDSSPPTSPSSAGASPRRSPVRMVSLVGVAILLAIMIVPTLRAYIGQREEHARLLASVEEQHRDIDELTRQLERLRDPAYKEHLARTRLHMVRPGETPYGVIRPDGSGPISAGQSADPAAPSSGQSATASQAWYASVMSRMQQVDEGRSLPTSTVLPGRVAPDPAATMPAGRPGPTSTASAPAGR